jgi:hypothetical protein
MSLPARQQRMLDGIDEWVRKHDARLASLFATFTRLTKHEPMPETEQLKAKEGRAAARWWRRSRSPGRARRNWRTDRPGELGPGLFGPGKSAHAQQRRSSQAKPDESAVARPGGLPGGLRTGSPGNQGTGWYGRHMRWLALVPIAFLAVLSVIIVVFLATTSQGQCAPGTPSYGAASLLSHPKACPLRQPPTGRG